MRTVYTDETKLHDRKYVVGQDMKPDGLWYSLDNEWKEWAEGNGFYTKRNLIHIEVDLSKVLIIENISDVKKLEEDFGTYIMPNYKRIDWEKIAEKYSGIEFRNFHSIKYGNGIRMIPTWFYALDCSSGCIWDLSIVKYLKTEKV